MAFSGLGPGDMTKDFFEFSICFELSFYVSDAHGVPITS